MTVAGGHSQLAAASRDGVPITLDEEPGDQPPYPTPAAAPKVDLADLRGWSFERLVTTALALAPQDLTYLREGAASNRALGDAVLDQRCPVPASLGIPPLGLDLLSLVPSAHANAVDRRIRSLVSAAVAARMTGQEWPVLTSAGSGNQGITVGIPISIVAETLGATRMASSRTQPGPCGQPIRACIHRRSLSSLWGGERRQWGRGGGLLVAGQGIWSRWNPPPS